MALLKNHAPLLDPLAERTARSHPCSLPRTYTRALLQEIRSGDATATPNVDDGAHCQRTEHEMPHVIRNRVHVDVREAADVSGVALPAIVSATFCQYIVCSGFDI